MYKLSKNQENTAVVGYALIWALIGFVTLFFMSQAILTAVYGAETLPAAFYQTVLTTENATNQTEGYAIDQYIENVQVQICHTIKNNATAVAECLNI